MTIHYQDGDQVEKLWVTVTLKAQLIGSELASVTVPVESTTVFIPTATDMQIVAGITKQNLLRLRDARQ